MVTVDRHEAVRADWLLAHEAGWHLSDRRMANALKRRAAKKDRMNSGSAESSHHEGRIKWIGSRFISHKEEAGEQMARWAVVYVFALPALALVAGPALVMAGVLYAVATTALLRTGRIPRSWPWLIAAAVIAAGVLVLDTGELVTVSADFEFDVAWSRIGALYVWVQAVLALLVVAWDVRRRGWPGVKPVKSSKTPEVPVAAAQKDKHSATASEVVAETTDGPKAPSLPAAPQIPELIGEDGDDLDEDDPIFDDEPLVVDEDEMEREMTHDR